MKLRRRFSSSLGPLFAHRVRTILALSGVAVGVAAVIVSRAIGAGAQQEMVQTIERMGTNLLIVKPVPVKRLAARPEITGLATTLHIEDSEAVAELPFVDETAPAVEGSTRVKIGRIAIKTTVRGTTPVFLPVRGFQVETGRFFGAEDNREGRRVAVLGARVNDELSQGRPLVGQEIRIRGVPFDVIGILRAKGTTSDGADQDNQVVVPLRTALRRVFNTTWLTSVYVSVIEPDRMNEADNAIQQLLRVRHQQGTDEGVDDFAVQNTAKTRAFQQEMTASLSRYATWLAAIALVVGGLGLLALMLLSVRERTGEIGLRVAVGAQPSDILIQFLIEATALALGGWIAGVVLGGAAALAVAFGTSWTIAFPMTAVAASFAMVVIIGLGFGALPAKSAARVPPIQALLRT